MGDATYIIKFGAEHVFRTFAVSEIEAQRHSEGLAGLIESKGGDINSFMPAEFADLLVKQLSTRCQWRDPQAKVEWEQRKRESSDGYNRYLDSRRPSPFKKW